MYANAYNFYFKYGVYKIDKSRFLLSLIHLLDFEMNEKKFSYSLRQLSQVD